VTGMPLHGMYTVNKILWLRDHEPEIFPSHGGRAGDGLLLSLPDHDV
jgi:hypothetical protein